MTRDDILRMAREAGFNSEDHYAIGEMLLSFANLIAAAEREEYKHDSFEMMRDAVNVAVKAEREACAQVCDEAAIRLFSGKSRVNQVDRHTAEVLRGKAEAIRARGNHD